ncbi:endonuclease/exonuclease/phosphatase family protein [Brevundimonas sp.]
MTSPVQPSKPTRHLAWRIVEALAILGLLAPLTLAVAALSGSGHRWIDILAQFTAPALTATVLLTALVAVTRLWRATAFGLIVSVTLLVAVWPQWFPVQPPARPGAPELTLYSANVHYLNTDIARMRRSIDQADPDIIVLVELSLQTADGIERLLGDHPYRIHATLLDQARGPARSIIASRYPLTRIDTFDDLLNDVAAVADTPLGPVNIVGVHLTRPWPYEYQHGQVIQTENLADLRRTTTGPMIVAGDFNSVSSARIGRQVRDEVGLHPAPGILGTWPSSLPSIFGMTIDQVYRSPDLTFTSRRLGRPNGSDHAPVVTTFTLAE